MGCGSSLSGPKVRIYRAQHTRRLSRRRVSEASCVSEPAKVGVVTVTYNSEKVIDAFMRCILKQDHENFIVYVIDNCSSDAALQRVAHYRDARIVVIANQNNLGVAEANNQGISAALQANCEHVLLLNNDTEF